MTDTPEALRARLEALIEFLEDYCGSASERAITAKLALKQLEAERTAREAAEREIRDTADAAVVREKGLRAKLTEAEAALTAVAQFIYPEIDLGPAINGWQNTVDMVEAALAAVSPPKDQA